MTSQFEQYCTVYAQIPLPKTNEEYNNLLPGLRNLNCNRRITFDEQECSVSSCYCWHFAKQDLYIVIASVVI